MSSSTQTLKYAALNNAELCELICSSNGTIGEFHADFWASAHDVVDYYPNQLL